MSALQVLAALRQQGGTLAELLGGLTLYPQVLVNVRFAKGTAWQGNPGIEAAQRAVEAELNGQGRVLLRASGTEPLLRVMVEGRDAAQVERLAHQLADAVRDAVGGEELAAH